MSTRRRGFRGFATSTAVSLALTVGGQTVMASVSEWGVAQGTGTVTVTQARETGMIPAGNILSATATGMTGNVWYGVQYRWTFSEGLTFGNLPTLPWSATNVTTLYGPRVSWCSTTTGEKQATVDAWDLLTGDWLGFQTVTFTAVEKNVNSNLTVVCVGTNSEDMPDGALGPYADINDAVDAAGWHTHFMIERGHDVAGNSTLSQNRFRPGDFRVGIHFSAYGPGSENAVLPGIWIEDIPGERTFENIDFVGGFDPTDPASNAGAGGDLQMTNGTTSYGDHVWTTFKNVTFNGLRKVAAHSDTVFCDIFGTNWQDFCIFLGDTYGNIGFLGFDLSQNPDAVLCNTGANDDRFAHHGSFRGSLHDSSLGPVCFHLGRLFNTPGWGGHPQALGRWNEQVAGTNEEPPEFCMSQVIGEGDSLIGGGKIGSAGLSSDFEPARVYLDKCHMTLLSSPDATARNAGFIALNCYFVIPNTGPSSTYSGADVDQFLRIGQDDEIKDAGKTYPDDGHWNLNGNPDGPFIFIGCSFLDMRSEANELSGVWNPIIRSADINLSGVQMANNFMWAASASGAPNSAALSYDVSWTPQHTGWRVCPDYTADPLVINEETDTATPAEAARAYYPGAPTGIDAGTETIVLNGSDSVTSIGVLPLDDFMGNKRTRTYLGAYDPAATAPLVTGESGWSG